MYNTFLTVLHGYDKLFDEGYLFDEEQEALKMYEKYKECPLYNETQLDICKGIRYDIEV